MEKREDITAWIEARCKTITDLCNDPRNNTTDDELGAEIRYYCNEIIAFTYMTRE